MIITSTSNKKIKEIQKLKDIKNIKKTKLYIVEGTHLVSEALNAGVTEEIFVTENYSNKILENEKNITIVSEHVMKQLTDTVNNQGIIAVCSIKEKELNIANYSRILILDKVQDPGNVGTMIRTADAFSFDCIILGKGTTSLYGQKVIRSMQGSHFHVDCFEGVDIENMLDTMEDFSIYATSLQGDKYLHEIDYVGENISIIFGNEGAGVSKNILEKVNNLLKIKMTGQAESLNVAVSAGIVMNYISMKQK